MKVFYIDPQSCSNLAVYDYSLLSGLQDVQISFYHSVRYDTAPVSGAQAYPVFRYNECGNPLTKTISYVGSMLRIAKDAVCQRPDVIHIQWFRLWIVDYLLLFFYHLLGIKVVFTAHNILPHNCRARDRFTFRKFYEKVDAIIVHSLRTKPEMAQKLHIPLDKIHVIHHGVLVSNLEEKDVLMRMDELRAQCGIASGDIVFSCMGVQNKYKGTDMVVQVWNKLIGEDKRFHLLVVGKNEKIDFSSLEHLSNVHINLQRVSNLDFEAYLRMSSVALLPYIDISQSGVLFSALMANVPVLVSDVGGLTEPLSYSCVGWNIGEPSVENLEHQMKKLISSPDSIWAVKNDTSAFHKVQDMYSWDKISQETQILYQSLLA